MRIVEVIKYGEEGYVPKYPESCPSHSVYGTPRQGLKTRALWTPSCVSPSASSMCCFLGRVEIMHEGRDITEDVDQIFALCGNDMPKKG